MRIIIVGCGKVGETIISRLVDEGHDIAVFDVDSKVINDVTNSYDVMGVVGNGASYSVLKEAGIEDMDLMIAVTDSDELNLLSCLFAKKAGNCSTIARIRNPEYYSDLYRRYAIYARNYGDNRLYRIASGANSTDNNWTEVCMRKIGHRMNGISVHFYAVRDWGTENDPETGIPMGKKGWALTFTDQEYYNIVSKALQIEDCVVDHMKVMDKYDPEKRIGLLVDEWGTWYNVEKGTNPGWLYQQNTVRDAIVAASSLDIFHKYTDRIKMANIAQVVNVLQSMILTNEKNPADPCVLTPTYYVFKMYNVHKEATYVPSDLVCNYISVNAREQIPTVSRTVSCDKDGVMHISLTNMDLTREHVVAVKIDGRKVKTVEGEIITADDVHAYNDFGRADQVKPAAFKGAKVDKKGQLLVTLPAHSVVTLTVK